MKGRKIMKNLKSFLVLLTVLLVLSPVSNAYAAEPIDEVRDLIKQYYVEDVPASTLAKPTIKEITDQLDPYSVYMSKQEIEEYIKVLNSEFVGIGVVLSEHEQGALVSQTIPDRSC